MATVNSVIFFCKVDKKRVKLLTRLHPSMLLFVASLITTSASEQLGVKYACSDN